MYYREVWIVIKRALNENRGEWKRTNKQYRALGDCESKFKRDEIMFKGAKVKHNYCAAVAALVNRRKAKPLKINSWHWEVIKNTEKNKLTAAYKTKPSIRKYKILWESTAQQLVRYLFCCAIFTGAKSQKISYSSQFLVRVLKKAFGKRISLEEVWSCVHKGKSIDHLETILRFVKTLQTVDNTSKKEIGFQVEKWNTNWEETKLTSPYDIFNNFIFLQHLRKSKNVPTIWWNMK